MSTLQPTPWPPPSEQATARSRFVPGVLVGALATLLTGALVVGLLFVTGVLGSADSERELGLPDSIGPLTREAENPTIAEQDPEWASSAEDIDEQTAASWSEAYDGASATAARYVDDELIDYLTVVAVAGPSPGLATVSYDLERVGLESPPTEVRAYGDVECLVRNLPSGEPDEAGAFVDECQRSSDDLTVRVLFASGDLAEDPETVASYVDEAFESLG